MTTATVTTGPDLPSRVELGSGITVLFDQMSAEDQAANAREIADGDLTCSLGARRAAVRMDLALAARIVAEGLARGLTLPQDEATALADALAKRQG